MCYAELVAMMPKSGGPYVFLRAAYPPVFTFLRGWAMFFVSETASIAAVALVFAEYSGALWSIILGTPMPGPAVIAVALFTIALLTAVNCFGVFLRRRGPGCFQLHKGGGDRRGDRHLLHRAGQLLAFLHAFLAGEWNWGTVLAVGAALRYSFFAYSGWEGATYVAEEVRNPRKNLPLSLFIGIAGCFCCSRGHSAYLYQLPVDAVKESSWIAVDAMQAAIVESAAR